MTESKLMEDMKKPRGTAPARDKFESHDQLVEHYGEPAEIGLRMHIDYLSNGYQTFIRRSPLIVIGTAAKDGMPSTSPKGDAPGFVKIVDERTILIPDRPGNNQIDTLHNLLDNPRISLIFFIPGVRETLRIKGNAIISSREDLRAQLSVNGKLPPVVIKVTVVDAYLHCGKALIRSKAWDPDAHAAKGEIPSIGKMSLELGCFEEFRSIPPDVLEDLTEKGYQETLY